MLLSDERVRYAGQQPESGSKSNNEYNDQTHTINIILLFRRTFHNGLTVSSVNRSINHQQDSQAKIKLIVS